MDSFTERMLERAKERQKKLAEYYNNTKETPKTPLQEPNTILKKYETASKSQPNLTECEKIGSDLHTKSQSYDCSLKENLLETNLNKRSCTRVSSDLQSSPQTPTKTLNIQKENFNMEIKLTSAENVRVEVEIEERDDDQNDNCDNTNDKPIMRENVKNRLQRLGKLYSGEDVMLSSPIHRSEEHFPEEEGSELDNKKIAGSRLGRLKDLANTRNQWEDDISTHSTKVSTIKGTTKKSWKPPAPKPPSTVTFVHSPNKGPAPQPPTAKTVSFSANIPSREASPEKSPTKTESKPVTWDNSVLSSLESQGFTRTNSNSRLIYNYNQTENQDPDQDLDPIKEEKSPEAATKISQIAAKFNFQPSEESNKVRSPTKTTLRCGDVLNKAAMFEMSPTRATKDPALMSVSERKALFEKNKGGALLPKAAFAMAVPVKRSPVKEQSQPAKSTSPQKSKSNVLSPTKASIVESGGIASKMKALLEKKSTISQSQIENKIQEQRQKDLGVLLNRFNKNKETVENLAEDSSEDEDQENISETTKMIQNRAAKIVQCKEKEMLPPPPPLPQPEPQKAVAPKRRSKGDSPKVREVLDDVKRIRVSPPKAGHMYPCLSDIEASATEPETQDSASSHESSFEDSSSCADSEEPDTSFGREILEVVCKNQTPQKRPILDESTASDLSDILDGMDDYLDEALAHDASESSAGPTPPKIGRGMTPRNIAAPSHSFHFSKTSPLKQVSPKPKSPKKSNDLPTHVVDGESVLPLTHTVSFYRKQQAQGSRTPVRQVTRQPAVEEESAETENVDRSIEVSEKIQELLNAVTKHQTMISQASQALNLCCSTIEFSGSSEQVEAERLLLVATQRRQAALHEVQRLRVESTLHSGGSTSVDKASLTISDIVLPLKKEYVRALSAAGGQGHHVVLLVRYAEHVIPTRLTSTTASPRDAPELKLRIPGCVKLDNIFSDFTITVEVYTLQAQEELLPHDVKYHINTKKQGGKLTPRKNKESKLVMPVVQSPAGPQAVRTTAFALVGYVVFSLQGIQRTSWTLNNAPPMSPLEGSIQMKISCQLAVSVEHRSFLTMFDDISGFGAWHRRWCLLKGHSLSYWKYPDDEKKKAPIDTINLQICTTKTVGAVSREICARPHTFLLETVRSARPYDKDSLVTVCRGDQTIIRHLLSADTKEERIEWCEKFNKTLDAIRLWGNNRK